MSPYRRNVLVGITVLGALITLGWMILKFSPGTMQMFSSPRMEARIVVDRADGLANGSPIWFRGVTVGQVTSVTLQPDMKQIFIAVSLNTSIELPANIRALIKSQGLIGGSSRIDLEMTGPEREGKLQAGQVITDAKYVGLDILPPEFTDLANELRLTSKQFRESQVVAHLDEQVQKIGKLIDSMQELVADPELREDLKASVVNMKDVTEKARNIGTNLEKFSSNLEKLSSDASATITQAQGTIRKTEGHIDELAKLTSDRIQQVSVLLDRMQSIAAKVDEGKGTAGLIVNDPKLYESLVDTTRELNLTISDLKRLVQQWEEEGMSFKLK